jgi:lysozyme family protein
MKKVFLYFLGAWLTFFYLSCSKVDHKDTQTGNKTVFSVSNARTWFESQMQFSTKRVTVDSKSSKIKAIKPLWQVASTTEDQNYFVVEVPLQDEIGFNLRPSISQSNNKVYGNSKLLLLEDKKNGAHSSVVMHFFSNDAPGSAFSYGKPPKSFNGYVFYTDLEGIFLLGWELKNGKAIKKSSKSVEKNCKNCMIAPITEYTSGVCSTTETDWYYRDCIEYMNGDYNCGSWEYIGSTYETYCPMTSDGGDATYTQVQKDCAGVAGGTATWTDCGCIGGTTGRSACPPPCNTYENRITNILQNEGGFVNNPNDPGGATNKGICWNTWQNAAPSILGISPTLENLQNLSTDDAKKIYKSLYWDKNNLDQVQDGDLRYLIFDFYVNAQGNAIKVLQATLNGLGNSVSVDGGMGSQTIAAINSTDPISLYNSFKTGRQNYYDRISRLNPKLQRFLTGWTNRVNTFKNKLLNFFKDVNC